MTAPARASRPGRAERAPAPRARPLPAWLAPALLLALVVLVFARLFRAGFLQWDDYANILYNARIVPPSLEGAKWFWSHAYLDLYVPLTFSTWSLLSRLGGAPGASGEWELSPFLFHATNVALHASSALLVHHLIAKLVGRGWPAIAGALFFALHPLQVETVGWVSGLKDLAYSFWSLLAVAGLLALFDREQESESGARFPFGLWLLASLAFALALFSKPTAIVLPAFAWLCVRWRFPGGHRWTARALLPWLAAAIGWAVLTRIVQPAHEVAGIAVPQRVFVAGHALAFYLWKLVWPFGLAIDYGWTPERVLSARFGELAILVPATVAAALLLARRRAPRALLAAALFVVPLAPVLGFVHFDFQVYSTVADHYVYLALFGPALFLASLLEALPPARRRAGLAAAAAVLLFLAARSFDQCGVWKDGESFFRQALRVNPGSSAAHVNLGTTYLEAGRLDLAQSELRAALAIDPGSGKGNFNLGVALVKAGEREAALPFLEQGVRGQPGDAAARGYLGTLLYQIKRYDQALAYFEDAVRLDPDSYAARYQLAKTLALVGQHARAAREFEATLRLRPGFAPAAQELARERAAAGGK